MKKSIIVEFSSGTPSSTYSVSTGYSVGSEWINTNNGNRFYHKTDGNWVPLNVESFYIQGGTSSAFDTTSDIYRTGSLNIGTGTATDGRFVVSSTTGSVSFVVDNSGSIYNYSTLYNTKFGYNSLYNNTTGFYNTAFGHGTLNQNTIGSYNTAYGAFSLYNTSTGVSTFVLSDSGSGYTASTTFKNVQLSYISGTTASTYPIVDVYVGSTGSVSTVTLVTTGTGFIDTTTVMGANLGSSATFSISVTTILTGSYNTAVGSGSLYSNTTGIRNTAVGSNSLFSNTTGAACTAVGRSSLYSNTTGFSNTVIGYQSLFYNISGSINTAIGINALLSNTTGSYSTALGYLTLRDSTTVVTGLGTFSVGSGYVTGTYPDVQLTYSSNSTALTYPKATIVIGAGGTVSSVTLSATTRGTGFKDTTTIMTVSTSSVGGTGSGFTVGVSTILAASGNTALGHQALLTNTTGSSNISIGFNSLNTNSTGSQNVAIGGNSLFFNTTGSGNTALGFNSSYYNTTANYNTAVGYQSLYLNTTGDSHTTLGYKSLYYNTTGSSLVALGYQSSFNNITGSNNTTVGYQSLFNATASSNNTAVGYQSLYSIIDGSNNNTAVGYHAGHYITSGVISATLSNWSTYIGSYTKGYAYDTTHEVVIGASAVGNGSYSVTLGNDNITKTILKGNIGVGTASPSTKLHVYGTQSGAFRLQDGTQANGYVLTSDANGVASWGKTSRLFNFASNTYQTVSGTVSATSSAISSSMFSDSDVLRIQPIITLLAPSVNVVNISYYISTSPTLVGATQIGNYNVIAGNRYIWSDRYFWTLGGIFIGRNFTTSSQSSENNSGNNLDSVSIPSTFYILVTAATTGTDLACISSVVIQKL